MLSTSILFEIAIALIAAKLLGTLFEKMKQPGVIGEIIAGIILGPSIIGSLSGSSIDLFGTSLYTFQLDLTSNEFKEIAFIGTIFLLFIVGMETDTQDLKKSRKSGLITCTLGVIVPFLFGFLVGFGFNLGITASLAIGAIFTATSIGVTLRILTKLDLLSNRVGLTILTADILDDVFGIFILALIIGEGNPFVLLLKVILFFVLTLGAGSFIIRYAKKETTKRRTPMVILTAGLVLCFLFAAFAENMGLAAIIGAFIAGMIIRKIPQAHTMSEYTNTIGYAFFIPLFFVWIGASFNVSYLIGNSQIGTIALFLFFFVLFALLGKVIGCYIGAKLSGFTKRESLIVGIGMMPRAGIALIVVATVIDLRFFGDQEGLLAQQVKIATILLVMISTFITPFLLIRSAAPPYVKKRKTFFMFPKK
ncbi:MAG: cation:proton antiporter [Euryarchaeota archaeon]|nr:cation:proton antiporter [Euryarchaeota archaeon]